MKISAFIIFAAAAIAAGCGSSPKPRFYTLNADAEMKQERFLSLAKPSVGIGSVTMPDSVSRPHFVVRTGANELLISDQYRWAEPLKTEVARVIAENLSRSLENPRVAAYPQSAALDADYRIALDFQRFEARLGGETLVDVLWTMRAADGSSRKSGRIAAREPAGGDSHEALAASYSRGLLRVSAELARELEGLPLLKR